MAKGTLVNSEQSFSIDVTLSDDTNKKLEQSSGGTDLDVEVFANQCAAIAPPQVAIRTPYECLNVNGINYHVQSVKGLEARSFRVVTSGTILILNVRVAIAS